MPDPIPVTHCGGTADAPLAAAQPYYFTRATSFDDRPVITLPTLQRGTWDDYGYVERPEQEVWFEHFLARIGMSTGGRFPGEFAWPDAATRDRVWNALGEALQPIVKPPPAVTLTLAMDAAEARARLADLRPRFCALAATLLGFDGPRFEQRYAVPVPDTHPPQRKELWQHRAGERFLEVILHGTEVASDTGVYDASTILTIDRDASDGRTARAMVDLDPHTGGTLSVTVAGVRNAQQLAERFLAPAA